MHHRAPDVNRGRITNGKKDAHIVVFARGFLLWMQPSPTANTTSRAGQFCRVYSAQEERHQIEDPNEPLLRLVSLDFHRTELAGVVFLDGDVHRPGSLIADRRAAATDWRIGVDGWWCVLGNHRTWLN